MFFFKIYFGANLTFLCMSSFLYSSLSKCNIHASVLSFRVNLHLSAVYPFIFLRQIIRVPVNPPGGKSFRRNTENRGVACSPEGCEEQRLNNHHPRHPGILCSSVSDINTVALNGICGDLHCGAASPHHHSPHGKSSHLFLPQGICSFTMWKPSSSTYRWTLKMDLMFFMRISTSKETYTSVLRSNECYWCSCPFISPAHSLMFKWGRQGRRGRG